ncbi:MAG TPA: phosphopantetheine-binding protein, partial [Candidatus Eisenbacteria bacterium]|nr:phosphopantetheine-binding protein [Candidatus Eisenbacteria bacterium]
LPIAEAAVPGANETFVPPQTPLEQTLARIWRDVLGVERVGLHDDFFEMGGHSLAATQVSSRLRELLRTDVPMRAFVEHPTLKELALAVLHRQAETGGQALEDSLLELEQMPETEARRQLESRGTEPA